MIYFRVFTYTREATCSDDAMTVSESSLGKYASLFFKSTNKTCEQG